MPGPGVDQSTGSPPPGPEVELTDALRGQLLDPLLWREGLEPYARATGLSVALTDAGGRRLGPCLNPRPTWSRLQAQAPAPAGLCPFALAPPRPCTCVSDAVRTGRVAWARDRAGLVHFALPLVLGGQTLGVVIAGQVFDRYPEQLSLEKVARKLGLSSEDVWQVARLEHPVKEATLRVYADLLATLADDRLLGRFHAIREADRLAELARLGDQLRQRTEQLIEADHRKDRFLAMLAHELRNPLAPILNAVQMVRSTAEDGSELEWAGDVMERQVQHLSRLVDDLLDVSRFTSGKIMLRRERTDLAAVVARALEATGAAIERRRQELSVTLPDELLPVEGDPVRLVQVFSNLVNNAAKFTPEGGRIWLTAGREGGGAVVRVGDTGVGLRAEMTSRIFDLFTQEDCTLDRAQGGLGIGLTLVRSLIELHGGTVHAFSEGPGRGSEFVVTLPLSAEPLAEPGPSKRPDDERTPLPPHHILVVDDNRDAANSLARLLRREGHEVQVAYDGPAAVAASEASHPDVVLLDIGLPSMDGYEVVRRLRQQPGMGEALVVAVSGYGQEEDRRRSREAGFDQHLVKPFDFSVLQQLLARPARLGAQASGPS